MTAETSLIPPKVMRVLVAVIARVGEHRPTDIYVSAFTWTGLDRGQVFYLIRGHVGPKHLTLTGDDADRVHRAEIGWIDPLGLDDEVRRALYGPR